MEFVNEVLENIWKDRYQKNDESFEENLERVAEYCSTNVEEREMFFDVMNKGLFYPAGRTMSNSGIGKDLTLNNCFVAPQIKDSLDDIFKKVALGAKTHQKGGGIGYDFSQLRPNGSPTSNDAIASGAISFMDVFNAQTATILQGNRRGANMGIMNIYSMDIEEFINAKSYEEGKLNHFNVSVMVDDDFISAVREDKKVFLHYPVYSEDGTILKDELKWKYKKEVSATYLWDLIMKKAYDNGEPGIFFYDNLNKDNNLWYIENIVATNPCFTGNMKLLTVDGYKTFEELDGKEIKLINKDGNISDGKVWCSGEKNIYEIRFANKKTITCTDNHVFMLNDGTECKAKNLKKKRIMPYLEHNNIFDEDFVKYGFIQGDGGLGRLASEYHQGLEVNIGKNDGDIAELFGVHLKDNERTVYLNGYNQDLIALGFSSESLPKREFPTTFNQWTQYQQKSFLRGCYSANGSVLKTDGRITYKTTCKTFAEQLKSILEKMGYKPYITTNKKHDVEFSNGTYECKESYDINIRQYESRLKFYNEIGFVQQYKMDKLRNDLIQTSPLIYNVVDLHKKEKVYDFNEPLVHWGVVEGFIAHNCAEYLAGTIYGSDPQTGEKLNSEEFGGACNLGSLFLHNFVKHPFTKNVEVDYDTLVYAIKVGVRFLDNIIDINNFPDEIYENYQKSFRTIGLGVTGLADMLVMLNLKYNSKDAHNFVYKLMDFIAFNAYKASIELAKEKGGFPFLDRQKFTSSGYLLKHTDNDSSWKKLINDIEKYGIRNAKILSIAPTGTLSLTFGNNCSSGIEPIFSLEYDRKIKFGGQDEKDIKIVKIQDYAYGLWEQTKEGNVVTKDKFITAMEMNVDDHIEMLKNIAYHVDMSVSKTINVPTDYSFEDTKNIYMKCHDSGIKGCTIFRPNEIRQGILITDNSKKEEVSSKVESLPRGYIIKADDNVVGKKRTLTTGCGSLHCTAFFDPISGELLETYFSKGSSGGCNNFMVGLSRMISLSARAGVDIHTIVDQLNSCGTCPSYAVRAATKRDTSRGSCCPVALGNMLIDMYKEIQGEINEDFEYEKPKVKQKNKTIEVQKSHKNLCPECNEELVNEGGCIQCKSCGWSKCN